MIDGLALQVAVDILVGTEGKPGTRRFTPQVGEQILLIDAVEFVAPNAGEVAFFSSPSMGFVISARMASWTALRWLACSFL